MDLLKKGDNADTHCLHHPKIRLAREFCDECTNRELSEKLAHVQCILQEAASNIATPRTSTQSHQKLGVDFHKMADNCVLVLLTL
jgi:hypothetical protein